MNNTIRSVYPQLVSPGNHIEKHENSSGHSAVGHVAAVCDWTLRVGKIKCTKFLQLGQEVDVEESTLCHFKVEKSATNGGGSSHSFFYTPFVHSLDLLFTFLIEELADYHIWFLNPQQGFRQDSYKCTG